MSPGGREGRRSSIHRGFTYPVTLGERGAHGKALYLMDRLGKVAGDGTARSLKIVVLHDNAVSGSKRGSGGRGCILLRLVWLPRVNEAEGLHPIRFGHHDARRRKGR